MTSQEIAQMRLYTQQLFQPRCAQPAEIVGWLGAVQAQDYAGAKWALAQWLPSATDATIEQALSDGAILRTHLLRPTWHFVAAADIRWLLALTAPRIHALNAPYYRKAGLDTATFIRSHDILRLVPQESRKGYDVNPKIRNGRGLYRDNATDITAADPEAMLTWLSADRVSVTFCKLDEIDAQQTVFENLVRAWLTLDITS